MTHKDFFFFAKHQPVFLSVKDIFQYITELTMLSESFPYTWTLTKDGQRLIVTIHVSYNIMYCESVEVLIYVKDFLETSVSNYFQLLISLTAVKSSKLLNWLTVQYYLSDTYTTSYTTNLYNNTLRRKCNVGKITCFSEHLVKVRERSRSWLKTFWIWNNNPSLI